MFNTLLILICLDFFMLLNTLYIEGHFEHNSFKRRTTYVHLTDCVSQEETQNLGGEQKNLQKFANDMCWVDYKVVRLFKFLCDTHNHVTSNLSEFLLKQKLKNTKTFLMKEMGF